MIITQDRNHGDFEIHSYEPGKIKINDTVYSQSVIVSSEQLAFWEPANIQQLVASNFESVLALKPDVVLLGTGQYLSFPDSNILAPFKENQIGVEVMSTLVACKTFNVLMSENRNAVAALLVW